MSIFQKDKSWVNRIIFPAPSPSTYSMNSFTKNGYRGRLCWIPRRQPGVRRSKNEHDSNSVPCLYYECRHPGATQILLYCHGNSEDLGNAPYMLANLRDTLNCHVIGIEYPGYGINHGDPSESALNNDVLVVYSFLTGALKWPAKNIILYGYSIGTGPTTQLASHKEIGGLVLIAPYTSIRDMVTCVLPKVGTVAKYLISNRFVNSEAIKSVTAPTLIIHGKSDSLIPFSMSQELLDNCGSKRKELYLAESLDHCYDEDDFRAFVLFPIREFFHLDITTGQKKMLRLPQYVLIPPESADIPSDDDNDEQPSHEEEKNLIDAFGPRVSSPSVKEWTCSTCTFINSPAFMICQMCETPQPTGINAWTCSRCTFQNYRLQDRCEMCLLKRTESVEPGSIKEPNPNNNNNNNMKPKRTLPIMMQNPNDNNDNTRNFDDDMPKIDSASLFDRALADQSSLNELTNSPWKCNKCSKLNESATPKCSQCKNPRLML